MEGGQVSVSGGSTPQSPAGPEEPGADLVDLSPELADPVKLGPFLTLLFTILYYTCRTLFGG